MRTERKVVERFDNDETKYLSWAEANPLGYIVNVVKTDGPPLFPTVHAVRHALWTSKRESYARADNIKICGSHFPFPGSGTFVKDGNAYAFTPVAQS